MLVFAFTYSNNVNAQETNLEKILIKVTIKKFKEHKIVSTFRLRRFSVKKNVIFWTIRDDEARKTFLFVSPIKSIKTGEEVDFIVPNEDSILEILIPRYYDQLGNRKK